MDNQSKKWTLVGKNQELTMKSCKNGQKLIEQQKLFTNDLFLG